jgi:hypothetical protein
MGQKKKQAKEKPLEKMTATELRTVAKEIPEISGVHGMNKAELVAAVKAARGIAEASSGKPARSMRDIKARIRQFKQERASALQAQDTRRATIYKRRISRLKKQTRRA